jgi:ferredoxin
LYFCLDSKGYYTILEVSENASFQVHPDPFRIYYDDNNTGKTHSGYKHDDDNHHTVRGTYNNGLNKEMNIGMQTMITDIDTPKGRFHIIVEPSLCMAFGSCETLAPKIFVVEKNKMINPKARIASETGASLEAILAAAQTCPTKAIKIIDRYTGEQVFP